MDLSGVSLSGQPGASLQHGHLGSALDSQQQQQSSQEGSQGAPAGQDPLTQQLQQILVTDLARFWTTTVAPSTTAIAQTTVVMQKEAAEHNAQADGELQGVMNELARVHGLVASFQDQIRETLSLLQG